MKAKEPKFMKELRQIRSQMFKEWKGKTDREILASIQQKTEISRLQTNVKKRSLV